MTEVSDNRPPFIVYAVEGDDDRSFWTRVGVAWPLQKRPGFSASLNAIPLSGRLVILERRDEPAEGSNGSDETASDGKASRKGKGEPR